MSKRQRPLIGNRNNQLFNVALILLLALSLYLGSTVTAQDFIPETIELRTGYVGVRYDLALADLLPKGAPPLRWRSICAGKVPVNVNLECPQGLGIETVRNTQTGNTEQRLVVQPTSADLQDRQDPTKPRTGAYFFEVAGDDGPGVAVRIRFKLEVKPLGVDAARFRPQPPTDRQNQDADELRNVVVGYSAARPVPKPPPAPTPTPPFVLVKSTSDEETIALTESFGDFDPTTVIKDDTSNRANFFIQDSDIKPLLDGTIGKDATASFEKGDYLVVHVIRWKDLDGEKSDPQRELWALFEKIGTRKIDNHDYEWLPHFDASDKGKTIQEKRVYDTRIYGSKRVYVLPIHLNTPSTWDIKYKLAVNQKIPAPIQNAMELAGTILGGGGPGEKQAAGTKDIWGARLMVLKYLASDLIVLVNAATPSSEFQVKEQNKDYSKKYDNEGKYRWDVSVGLPVNSIKELEYKIDTTGQNNVVSAKKVERQNAYGFLNLFFKPVDLNSKSFLTTPHLVLGVPISGKPLDRPIIGLGSGIYRDMFKINFFAGVSFNKVKEPQTLQVGSQASEGQLEADFRTLRKPKFVIGINFPVRQFLSAIKKND